MAELSPLMAPSKRFLTITSRFFWYLYLHFALVAVLAVLALVLLANRQFRQEMMAEADGVLRDQAALVAAAMADPLRTLNYTLLRERVASLSASTGKRYTVIDPRGVVLADSHENPFDMGNHLQRPEVLDAVVAGSGLATRYSRTLQEEFRYFAIPILYQEERLGFMRSAQSMRQYQSQVGAHQGALLGYASLILFIALLAGYYLCLRLALPVARMTRLAEEVAGGGFERRLPVSNRTGLGKLGQAINEMARHSAQRVAEITSDRNRLAAIFAGMVEGVIDINQQQKILHINDAAAAILGINPKTCLNKPLWEEVRLGEITRALDRAIRTRDVVKTQMRLSREAGELVVDIYAASLSTGSGEPIGAVIVLNDITELEALERVRTDFVANASHELKTPITAIRGLAETLLSDDGVDPQTMNRFVDRIHKQSERLSRLVSDLMAISRLEAPGGDGDFVPVNLSEVVRRAVQAVETVREEKRQSIRVNLPPQRLLVSGDSQNLHQLMDNLVDNAVKYTPAGGEVEVSLKRDGDRAVLTVKDNGIGISPQYQQRVFERFYRVDKARSQSLGGTGLGLSIVKNIAEKHGGTVALESQLGRGSRFVITLPGAH